MFSKPDNSWLLHRAGAAPSPALLSGCSSKDDELRAVHRRHEERAGRPRRAAAGAQAVRDLSRTTSANMRSPFMPGGPGRAPAAGVRPDRRRNREFLEQFSLDTLRMVGTLRLADRTYGLVQDQRRPRASRAARQLPRPGRRQDHRDIAFEDQCRGNRSGRSWRLHGAARRARLELNDPRQGVDAE